jgi:glycosyltransferase involved in cell wall biosynthesis
VTTLADALRDALTNPALRATYAAEGRHLVEEHYAADIIIGQTLAIYEDLLGTHR